MNTINSKPYEFKINYMSLSIPPKTLAECFCNMDPVQQAEFFNAIFDDTQTWDGTFAYQMSKVVDTGNLSVGALRIMRTIGEYGEPVNDALSKQS